MKKKDKTDASLNGIRRELEKIMGMGHHSYRVYEDFIGLIFYALQRDDPHYLEIMGRYANTAPVGEREADYFSQAFGNLLAYMAETNDEALGVLFMEFAASQHKGQFFTPMDVARLMAKMTQINIPEGRRFTVADPACGAGIGLIACAKEQTFEQNGRAVFVGQDIDLNCVRMCAVNMALFNLNALVIWGNSLTLEVWGAWETRRNAALGGQIVEVDRERARAWIAPAMKRVKTVKMEQATLL